MILDYLKNNVLVTDGAMGTYYYQKTNDYDSFSELANLNNPEIIKEIHNEYIEAGAKLIETNTFSANTFTLELSREEVKEIIVNGIKIAKAAAKGKEVFVAGSIGPITKAFINEDNKEIMEEYKFITDIFIENGIEIIVFETFSSLEYIGEITSFIKNKNKDITIITNYEIMPNGFTREGISIKGIVEEVKKLDTIDIYGFNCGVGPSHIFNLVKSLDIFYDNISVIPNSGYPEFINNRTVYVNNPEYFADRIIEIKNLGAKIVGGCCGTTPEHIKKIVEKLNNIAPKLPTAKNEVALGKAEEIMVINEFSKKLSSGEFVLAVELDPPFDTKIQNIMEGAKICKANGVDLITVADSPMSKVRVDSVMISAKIKREIGIDAMPHICCRDKNINAIRSNVLAAHIEGIRNILAVTGDPVSSADKMDIKNVFNLNSFKLIELISQMNKDVFKEDKFKIGGALNLNVLNKDLELTRMYKKIERGATFFLTQPIYEDETIQFLSKIKRDKNIKILGGILPLVSYRNAQFINNELPGVNIPKKYLDKFGMEMTREEGEKLGIEIAVEIAKNIINYVDGIYLMTPFNRFNMIVEIINKIKAL
jgi:homocysteine S-methyltransferase